MTIKEKIVNKKEGLVELFGKGFFSDVPSLGLIFVSLMMLLAIFLLMAFKLKPTESLVPLVYNSTYGVTNLGPWYKMYSYPLIFAAFSFLNFSIAWAFFDKKRLITYLVLFVNIILGILLFVNSYYLLILIRG